MGNDGSDHVSDIPWNNIEIDSLQGTLRLLEDRLQCLVMILQECGDREVCMSDEYLIVQLHTLTNCRTQQY